MKRADTERVTVDVASVVQLSAESWQADWVEKTWDKDGGPGASYCESSETYERHHERKAPYTGQDPEQSPDD